MSVMLFHFFAPGVSPIHDELAASMPTSMTRIIQEMYCGVNVFFVLSGFVIAFSMDGQTANLRYAGNFIVRRSLRLDPPYWAAMALMIGYFLLLWPTKWHDFYLMYGGMRGVAANLFYLQNLSFVYPANSILDVSWTLCLEVQFYLTYLLVLVTGHYSRSLTVRRATETRRAVVVLSLTSVAVWSYVSWILQPSDDFTGRAWTFLLGVAVYGALTRGAPTIAVAVFLAALAVPFVWKQETEGIVTVATASVIFVSGLMGWMSTLLAYRPLLHLGKISYCIYLMHMVIGMNILSLLSSAIDGSVAAAWIALAMAIVLSLFGAELLHRRVEAPSNRLGQRLKRPRPVQVALHGKIVN